MYEKYIQYYLPAQEFDEHRVIVGISGKIEDYPEMEMKNVEMDYLGNWYIAGYAPEKPVEQTAAEVRAERDNRIAAVRWRIERYQTQEAVGIATTETAEQYQALLMYIQALRNVPKQDGFPDNVVWPTLDAEIEAVNNMATVEASTD